MLFCSCLALAMNLLNEKMFKNQNYIIIKKIVGHFIKGDKYSTAMRYNTPCINLLWLRHLILQDSCAFQEGWKRPCYDINKSEATKETLK